MTILEVPGTICYHSYRDKQPTKGGYLVLVRKRPNSTRNSHNFHFLVVRFQEGEILMILYLVLNDPGSTEDW